MKKSIINILGVCAASVMLGVGCTKDFDKINTDPTAYNPTNFEPNYLLTTAQLTYTGSTDFSYETWRGNLIYSGTLMQQISSVIGYWAGDKYLLNSGYTAAYWEKAYPDQVKPASDLMKLTEGREQYKNLYQISRIVRAMILQRITDLYGDVPYFSAGLGYYDGVYFPVYDKQEAIYADLIKVYEEAAMALDPAGDKPSGDAFYGGKPDQIQKWQKLAYSLLLRAGMRLTKVNPTLAQSTVAKCIGKTMASNADDAFLVHDASGGRPTVNRNAQVLLGDPERDYVKWSKTLIDYMKLNTDPRVSKIAAVNVTYNTAIPAQTGGDQTFALQKGMPNGYDLSGTPGRDINSDSNYTTMAAYSTMPQYMRRLDAPTFIMTYGQTQLLFADAAQRWNISGLSAAATYYNEGVRASMTYMAPYDPVMVVATADVNAYLALHPYAAGTGLEQTGWQYFILTSTMMDFYEGWANWRRTAYPALTPVKYPGNATGGTIPRRFPYPLFEANTNPTNYAAASGAVPGGDNLAGRVWWDSN